MLIEARKLTASQGMVAPIAQRLPNAIGGRGRPGRREVSARRVCHTGDYCKPTGNRKSNTGRFRFDRQRYGQCDEPVIASGQ